MNVIKKTLTKQKEEMKDKIEYWDKLETFSYSKILADALLTVANSDGNHYELLLINSYQDDWCSHAWVKKPLYFLINKEASKELNNLGYKQILRSILPEEKAIYTVEKYLIHFIEDKSICLNAKTTNKHRNINTKLLTGEVERYITTNTFDLQDTYIIPSVYEYLTDLIKWRSENHCMDIPEEIIKEKATQYIKDKQKGLTYKKEKKK